MQDSGGSGRITVAGGNFDGTVLNGSGGQQNRTLTTAQIPTHTHSGTTGTENQNHTHNVNFPATNQPANTSTGSVYAASGGSGSQLITATENQVHNHSFTTDGGTGGGGPHPTIPPTIIM